MSTISPLARARQRLAAITAEAAAKPRALCAVCGGPVAAGTGLVDGEPNETANRIDAKRTRGGLVPLRAWTRTHAQCADPVHVVKVVTGLDLSAEVAAAALGYAHRAPLYVDGMRIPGVARIYAHVALDPDHALPEAIDGKAWSHVDAETARTFTEVVRETARTLKAPGTAVRCVNGACGSCGVAKSTTWHASPMKWADGSAAPWCADCYQVARRRPWSSDLLRIRAVALEVLSGANDMFMADEIGDRMRLFCEIAGDDHAGTSEPWTFAAEAWADARELARRAFPSSLPDDLRQHYLDLRAAELEAAIARAHHERQGAALAAEKAAGWPIASASA